MRVVVNLCSDR